MEDMSPAPWSGGRGESEARGKAGVKGVGTKLLERGEGVGEEGVEQLQRQRYAQSDM